MEVIDEFRTFVKPTWRPTLSDFCKDLTGITQVRTRHAYLHLLNPEYTFAINDTQKQVDSAPLFPAVMEAFQNFMVKHGLLDGESGERLVRFCWCSDGPFDVRDFVVKQCFISKVSEYIGFRILVASISSHDVDLCSRYRCQAGFKAMFLISEH